MVLERERGGVGEGFKEIERREREGGRRGRGKKKEEVETMWLLTARIEGGRISQLLASEGTGGVLILYRKL